MKKIIIFGIICTIVATSSCDSFLDKKQDIKMAVPTSLRDADYLLNDYTTLNGGYPILGEIGIDDYYVTKERWNATSSLEQRNAYIWADESYMDILQWQRPYKTVFIANQVLSILEKVNQFEKINEYNRILGAAYFYRAFAFQQLVAVHCPAYNKNTADNDLGIPLRSDPGIDEPSVRASLKDSYKQIIKDFKEAAAYLPRIEVVKGRPFKASAYAGLARAYLDMAEYGQAYLYADSCLQLNPTLLNYNDLKSTDALPIPRFNVEVLFPALSATAGIMGATSALIDSTLYQSYSENDLRKEVFFKPTSVLSDNYYFKGSYDKSSAVLFMGFTTSEMYLIKAEAGCRLEKLNEARVALNTLLKSRWKTGKFVAVDENSNQELLKLILSERRKEMVLRGRRWADLKRLNLESNFKKDVHRNLDGSKYILQSNSQKYAFKISETVIKLSGIPQNKR